ncbi:MAG: hypothetical protein IJX18_03380 [Clostridia bacterium]|nr:hypothetical protein [Clostridia bacterium]
MLKKLLKYELTFMGKFLIIYYAITLSLALLTRLFFAIDTTTFLNILAEIFSGAHISFLISTLINVLMRYWVRFRRNFYADESYLTHTLPIEKRTQYAAKVLGGIITMSVTVMFLIGCVLIAYGTTENFEFLKNTLGAAESALEAPLGGLIALVAIVFLLECMHIQQAGFLGTVLGHRKQNAKIGFSVLFAIVVYLAAQVLMVISIVIVGLFNESIMQLLTSNQLPTVEALTTLLIVAIVFYALTIAATYIIGEKFFEKGVNVD